MGWSLGIVSLEYRNDPSLCSDNLDSRMVLLLGRRIDNRSQIDPGPCGCIGDPGDLFSLTDKKGGPGVSRGVRPGVPLVLGGSPVS